MMATAAVAMMVRGSFISYKVYYIFFFFGLFYVLHFYFLSNTYNNLGKKNLYPFNENKVINQF